MSLGLYLDVNVTGAITRGLRRRGVDVLTAQEDGASRWSDIRILDRATALTRLVFTCDTDFLTEAVRRQREGLPFATVIYISQVAVVIGRCVNDLELISKTFDPPESNGRIVYLPL